MAGTFNAQGVTNTLWAYATMGREPGAGLKRELEGRAEAMAGTFNAHNVANTMWESCVFSIFRSPAEGSRWVHTATVIKNKQPTHTGVPGQAFVLQCHQIVPAPSVFVGCSVEGQWRMEALKDLRSLTDACRKALVVAPVAPSATQQQVSESLRHLGLSVEDGVRCPKSGNSIDILVDILVTTAPWGLSPIPGDARRDQKRAHMGSGM